MKYGYKQLKKEELQETLELVKRVFDEFEAPYYSKEGVENFYKFANYENIEKSLNDNLKIMVAKDYQKIIGMIAIRDNTHIAMLFVDKEYHKQGIAKNLIREAKGEYKLNNEDITVNSSPYAVEFYKKVGFEIVEPEKEVDGIRFTPMKLEKYKLNNAKGELELVFPTEEYKEQVMDFLQEHIDYGEKSLNGAGGLDRVGSFEEWLEKIKNDVVKEVDAMKVPSTQYMAIRKSDKRLIGLIQIRHVLNERLASTFGNIGDGVRPSERKKGYVTEMIRLALIKCKEMGMKRVLMSCDKNNIGSKKSIMNNGGILEREFINDDLNILEQQYWITLKNRSAHLDSEKYSDIEVEEKTIKVNEEDFKGDIHLNKFNKVKERFLVPSGICIQDNNYKWLEFYDYNSKFKLTAIYDENNEIIEWYFDLVRRIDKRDGMPNTEDFYLDVVLNPQGRVIILDEDEFESAYKRYEMTKEEYDEGKRLVSELANRLENKENEVKDFTDKYLKKMLEE